MNAVTIDIRGQICPSTLLTALRVLNANRGELRTGSLELILLTDARDATHTIPEAASNMGYRAEVEAVDGYYEIRLRGDVKS